VHAHPHKEKQKHAETHIYESSDQQADRNIMLAWNSHPHLPFPSESPGLDDEDETVGVGQLKSRLSKPSLTCMLRVSTSAECGTCQVAMVGSATPGFYLPSDRPSSSSASPPACAPAFTPATPITTLAGNTQAREKPLSWFLEHRIVPYCSADCARTAASASSVRSSPLVAPSSSPMASMTSSSYSPCSHFALDSTCGDSSTPVSQEKQNLHLDDWAVTDVAPEKIYDDQDVLMLDDLTLPPAEQLWTHCGYISDSNSDSDDDF